jgi:hypothetical protein
MSGWANHIKLIENTRQTVSNRFFGILSKKTDILSVLIKFSLKEHLIGITEVRVLSGNGLGKADVSEPSLGRRTICKAGLCPRSASDG